MSLLIGQVGAGAAPPADSSSLPCVSSHLTAVCFALMLVELQQAQARCELTLQHIGCAEDTRSSHPWEGDRGHRCMYAHMSTPPWLCVNTRLHRASIWNCALRGKYLFRQKNITAPVPATESFLFFFQVLELLLVYKNSTARGSLPDRWNSFPLRRNWWKSPLLRHF